MNRAALFAAVLALSPFTGYAQSANTVAGLQEDVSALRDEVRKLRAELDDVREAQTRIETAQRSAKPTGASADAGAVNARIAAVEAASASARKSDKAEILADVNRKVAALEASVNKALADQTAQVNAALRSGAATKPRETAPTPKSAETVAKPEVPAKPAEVPVDMPKTGTRYTVVLGDSVGKIARKLNSKPAWILAANGLRSNADLKAHSVIFVPQAEAAAEAPKSE